MNADLDQIDIFFIRLAEARAESEPLKWTAKEEAALEQVWERIGMKLDQQKAV